jgi:hypothetical protein
VTATFSSALDATTVTSSTFTLSGPSGAVAATVIYDSASSTARLTPNAPLNSSATYTATLSTAIKASDGTPLADPISWTYATAASLDVQPPTAPGSLQAAGAAGQISLSWNASTDDVGVASYDIYRSTTPGFTPSSSNRIGQPTGTTYTDKNLAPGTYYYLAAAEDAAGNISAPSNQSSAAVADTTAPTVSITSPAAGATASGTTTVTAGAADNVGVVGVQFKIDGSNLGSEDTTSPYTFAWDTTGIASGTHTLTAVARDAAGNTTTSAPISVTVSNATPDTTAPTVSITSPTNGSSVTGTMKITAGASDAGSGIASVAFYLDGELLGTATSSPYTTTWNTRKSTPGQHTLYATAKDKAGNSQQSAAIIITVR